jgi:hypothetical protein
MTKDRFSGIIACLAASLCASEASAEDQPPVGIRPQAIRFTVAPPPHPSESINIRLLGPQSDFSIFVDRDCPDEVQRRALRHLWKLLPKPEPGYDLG